MAARVIEVSEPGGDLVFSERPVPIPGPGQVRVRVEACGICHSDVFAKDGGMPGSSWPLVPGHEVAGLIDDIGPDVHGWQSGQRVGVGWFGGNCGWCGACRSGDLMRCSGMPIPGVTIDGGYADYLVVRASALAAIPDGMTATEVAPLMCAGVTTFNALRRSTAQGGDLVAVLGLGGLGHLGVQYASKLGYETVAIARGAEKEDLARRCGAHAYIDSTADDPGAKLAGMGGAKVILCTAPSADAIHSCLAGLGPTGQTIVVGIAAKPIRISASALIGGASLLGHASGTAKDSEDTLRFSALTGVRAMVEARPLEEAPSAYERMVAGQARFRMVLTT